MNADDPPLHGRCTSGAVRYRLDTAPMLVHCCHCRWCQRETGSMGVTDLLPLVPAL